MKIAIAILVVAFAFACQSKPVEQKGFDNKSSVVMKKQSSVKK